MPLQSLHFSAPTKVLITGAGGDIGGGIARRLYGAGSRLVLVDASESALRRTVDSLDEHAAPDRVQSIVADVREESAVQAYVATAEEFLGGIDAFFNNAGIAGRLDPVVAYDFAEFQKVIEINLFGAFLGLRQVLRSMLAAGAGAIVNSASISGLRGTPNFGAYVASKHAVVGLTRTAALEVAHTGIRINAICPASVDGNMVSNNEAQVPQSLGGPPEPTFAQRNPTGRLASIDEVVNVAVFLASPGASYVNGATWLVDGGRSAR